MKRYVIERNVPGIGASTDLQLCSVARTSNAALEKLASEVQWVESFVAADKTFCVYLAANEEAIHKHAELSGFPANTITEIAAVIDPITANLRVP